MGKIYYVATQTNGDLKFLSKENSTNLPWQFTVSSANEVIREAKMSDNVKFRKWKIGQEKYIILVEKKYMSTMHTVSPNKYQKDLIKASRRFYQKYMLKKWGMAGVVSAGFMVVLLAVLYARTKRLSERKFIEFKPNDGSGQAKGLYKHKDKDELLKTCNDKEQCTYECVMMQTYPSIFANVIHSKATRGKEVGYVMTYYPAGTLNQLIVNKRPKDETRLYIPSVKALYQQLQENNIKHNDFALRNIVIHDEPEKKILLIDPIRRHSPDEVWMQYCVVCLYFSHNFPSRDDPYRYGFFVENSRESTLARKRYRLSFLFIKEISDSDDWNWKKHEALDPYNTVKENIDLFYKSIYELINKTENHYSLKKLNDFWDNLEK